MRNRLLHHFKFMLLPRSHNHPVLSNRTIRRPADRLSICTNDRRIEGHKHPGTLGDDHWRLSIGNWSYQRRIAVIPQLAYGAIYLLCRAVIPMSVKFGEGTELAYGGLGIVLHERTGIGRYVDRVRCFIGGRSRRWGTGDRRSLRHRRRRQLLGPISVGESSVIGANAVVWRMFRPTASWRACRLRSSGRASIFIHSCLQPPEEADRLSFGRRTISDPSSGRAAVASG
jgi:hypothetical protein